MQFYNCIKEYNYLWLWKKWGNRSLSKFNKGHCRVLQVGINNPVETEDQPAGKQPCRKRPGILVENKLDMSQQCASAANIANTWGALGKGWVKWSFPCQPWLWPHLKCWVLFCASQYKADMDKLEQVQQRRIKMVKDWNTSYEEAGKAGTGHFREGSLKDLITVYKQPNERSKEDRGKPFWVVSSESARGNQRKFNARNIKIY